jgi:hypothetical protein
VGRCSELWAPAKLSPHNCTVHQLAPVAQRIEHLTTDQKVGGSNPSGRAIYFAGFAGLTALYRALWREKLVLRLALSGYFPFGNSLTPMIGYTDGEPERRESAKWSRII